MKMQPIASILSLTCAWILWEQSSLSSKGYSEPHERVTSEYLARGEADSFEGCAARMQQEVNRQGALLKDRIKGAKAEIGNEAVISISNGPGGKPNVLYYHYKCLPGKMDPRF